MKDEREGIGVREAVREDATSVRLLVTRTLLSAGYDPPSEERDVDLYQPDYYRRPDRGLWVTVDEDGRVVGCAALDRGAENHAILKRLAGEGLHMLAHTAVTVASQLGYRDIETVLAPRAEETREALEGAGFEPEGSRQALLYRRRLRTPSQ